MSNYPTLNTMGVQHPLQINSYTIYQPRPDTDILRIKYERPKGSFLPVTRSYTFGRTPRIQLVDSATGQTETVYEITATLSKAITELDSIVQSKHDQHEIKQHLLSELERVQHDFAAEMIALRQLVEKLDA